VFRVQGVVVRKKGQVVDDWWSTDRQMDVKAFDWMWCADIDSSTLYSLCLTGYLLPSLLPLICFGKPRGVGFSNGASDSGCSALGGVLPALTLRAPVRRGPKHEETLRPNYDHTRARKG
jgi:hypothetical protein